MTNAAAASASGCNIAARRDAERTPEHRCKGARAVIAEVERDMGHRLARREAGQADAQQRLAPPGAKALADFPGKQPGEVALADTGGARTVRDRSIRNRLRAEAPQLQRACHVPPTALPYPILWRLSRPSQSRAAPCSAWPVARPHGLRSASRTGRTQVLRAERLPIPHVYPEARVIAYADDCLVLHPERAVLEQSQQRFSAWRAGIGLTLNTSKTRISHTLEGDQPGMDVLGFPIRQYRVGKHQSGKGPRGAQRLGYTTLIRPAKANVKAHLAELGRMIRQGQDWPQAALIRQLNPTMRGWANSDRTWVSQATCSRLDHLLWVKLRRWAYRRHPHTAARGIHHRYWRPRDSREVFATPETSDHQVWLTNHSEIPYLFHAKVTGNRSPYDGDWVYWSRRRGHDPTVKTRVATLLKQQHGRCAYCGQYFQHDDQREGDHMNGDRRNARYTNLQALHGHCHDAKTREHGAYLPVGRRDKHQHTEERRDRKRSCAVLKQR